MHSFIVANNTQKPVVTWLATSAVPHLHAAAHYKINVCPSIPFVTIVTPNTLYINILTFEHYARKFEGEEEPGTESCPPMAFPAVVGQEFNKFIEKGHGWVWGEGAYLCSLQLTVNNDWHTCQSGIILMPSMQFSFVDHPGCDMCLHVIIQLCMAKL